MMKRIIALLLALILTVGLLPTVALAAEGETPATDNSVVIGKIENGSWSQGAPTKPTVEGVKTVDKAATKIEDNKYQVTLTVVLEQTEEEQKPGTAATVLVLDTSGSMAYCAECGAKDDCVHNYIKFNGTPKSSTNYYYKTKGEKVERAYYCDGKHEFRPWLKHSAGWFTTSGDELLNHHPTTDSLAGQTIYVKSATPRASRLDAAKTAAQNFLRIYSGLKFDNNGNLITGQTARNLGRYVSVVTFATGVTLRKDWVDVSDPIKYAEVLSLFTSNNLKADGGTNLDAGLTYAEYLLKKDTVKNATKSVIALTDGEPTYYLSTNKRCIDGDCDCKNGSTGVGTKSYYVHGHGNACSSDTKPATDSAANAIKANGFADLYTICFGVANDKMKQKKDGNHIEYWPNNLTVGQYLQSIASSKAGKQFAYTADNAEQLNTAFVAITDTIVSGLNTGTVKDSLPKGITATGMSGEMTWKLDEDFTAAETVTTTEDGRKVTTYKYTKTYTVTINPDDKDLVTTGDGYAPLNGETTLTVEVAGEEKNIPFPIPAGKVTMPSYTVTWKSQDGNNTLETDSNVEYNTKPTFNSDAPTKADDAQYTYTFVGWATEANRENGTPEADLPAVTDDVTYYAAFSKTPRTYTVTWMPQDGQGNAYETDTGVAYNARPSYDSEVPTKAADDKYTYTFAGWATTTNQTSGSTVDALPNVTENVTYYAAFSATPRTYTVTYTDGVNGTAFAVQTTSNVAYSAPIPAFNGDTPTREGYNFNGWTSNVEGVTPSSTMPASDVTFTAQWKEKDKVTINYVAKTGGSVTLANETLNPDTGVAVGSTATANTGYRFVGWYDNSECTGTALSKDASYTPLKPEAGWADKTYYAKFESLTYTITFKTENGGTINDQTNDITHPGLTAGTTFPAVPTTKANTGYYFLGWYDESGDKVEETAFPEKVTGNATYTAKWHSYNSINLDLTGKIQKTLNSDVALTNEIFTINLTLDGAEVPSATATATVSATTASGTGYTGSAPFQTATDEFKLTFTAPGIYNYSIVEEQPVRSGMTYDDGFATTGHSMTVVVEEDAAHALSVASVTVDGTVIAPTDTAATWLTVTNEYKTPSTGTVTKKTIRSDMYDGMDKGIWATLFGDKGAFISTSDTIVVDKNTNEVTLAYEVSIVGEATATAKVEDDGAEYVTYDSTVDGVNVNYDETTKIATVTFAKAATAKLYYVKTFTRENGEFATAKNFVTVNDGKPVPSDETTITDKDPGSFDFSEIIRKELKLTGSKSFTGAEFEATLTLKDFKQEVLFNSMLTTYAAEHVEAWPEGWSRTLVAKFDTTAVDGSTTNFLTTDGNHLFLDFPAAGTYKFELQETNKTRTNVTYDDTVYTIVVKVTTDKEHQNYDKLVVAGIGVEYVDKDGNKVTEDVYIGGEAIGKVMTFVNTVDTGKDDYYPIIIPTIINKDTGMLNKTDHFAYVIGYPDGTVHPNGQITRAEVATIFFRLLRDEVRDGAFTTSNTYSDVAYGKWYNNPISTMSALGIITGYPDGTFKPNKPITRAEFAAIAARFDETQSGKSATFSDVIGHWAAKEIGIAYYNDWIKGYPDGTFKPDQNITRAEAMTLINRVLERKPESPADLLTNMNKWTDNMDTSKWYYLDVQEATNSHGYTRKTFNYELWRQMLPDPDWSRYER